MSTVRILNEQTQIEIPVDAVRRMAGRILTHLGHGEKELSVVFTDDASIRRLNRQYLGKDRPTNVLSMSQTETPDPETPAFENRLLGDVVVSVETCAKNAVAAGMEPLEEVIFCLVHGIAHLSGYDHEGERASGEKEMQEIEADLFRRFGSVVFGKKT